ncbi:MAG: ABC transporter permease [Pseudomonadota bacterium]
MTDTAFLPLETRRAAAIVPPGSIAGQALATLVAIMSFLACVTVGGVSLVQQSAATWQSQISREATIQIRPAQNFDIDAALADARLIAAGFDGVRDARIIGTDETADLLEPWVGSGLDFSELPVPRLVVITIDETSPPDFAAMASAIESTVANASLDDHRTWVDQLVSMARTMVFFGICVLLLVMASLLLTVVFATRGAMSSNHEVIEVLHFIGARGDYIARQFERRFFLIGLAGGGVGAFAAVVLGFAVSTWGKANITTAEGEQMAALFGDFSIPGVAYLGMIMVLILVSFATAATTRWTVIRTLYEIDERRADPSA